MRLNLYDWPMLFHVFSAMAWVGGLVGLSTIGRHVRRSGDPAAAAHQLVRWTWGVRLIVAPLAVATSDMAFKGV